MSLKNCLLLTLACLPLSGCVIAALPLAAAGAMAKSEIDRQKAAGLIASDDKTARQGIVSLSNAEPGKGQKIPTEVPQMATDNAVTVTADAATQSAFMQALSETMAGSTVMIPDAGRSDRVYLELAQYAARQNGNIKGAEGKPGNADSKGRVKPTSSAVLVKGVSLDLPKSKQCTDQPPAIILDLDSRQAQDSTKTDGAATADPVALANLSRTLAHLRGLDINIIWMSERPATQSPQILARLQAAGLIDDEKQDFLSLSRSADDRKQLRRWTIADYYCVLAIAGDSKGDFDELYDYLRKEEYAWRLVPRFGSGWFLLPQPWGLDQIAPAPKAASAALDPVDEKQQETP